MANYIASDTDLTAVANAIRTKGGTSAELSFPDGFVSAVQAISGGGIIPTGTKQISIAANGTTTTDVTNYANAEIAVNVPGPSGTKQVSVTQNGTTTEDIAAYASAQIVANVPNSYAAADEGKVVINGALVSQTSDSVTQNGTVDTTLINSLTVNVSGSGTAIADGVVVKARNANGYVTEVDKYGDCGPFEFGISSLGYRSFAYGYLEKVFLHDCDTLGVSSLTNRFITSVDGLENIVSCGASCFMYSGLQTITLPNVTSVGNTCFRQVYETCKNIYLPVLSTIGSYCFQSSTGLETVQIGSVGHPAPLTDNQSFYACTQATLTITAYATGANVDTLVANYRKNATAATIIIKASEATTYNGAAYAAGDTILTSEVA